MAEEDIPELPTALQQILATAKARQEAEKPVRWIVVHQQKAHLFRVVHADGAWCSLSPANLIHLTFYNDRYPLPRSIQFPVNAAGVVGNEDPEKREMLKDWVREMEVDIVLSLESAKLVRQGLDNFIALAEKTSPLNPVK